MIAQNDVIYYVLTDRFADGDKNNNFNANKNDPNKYHGGDFVGIIEKIPYLKNLGITTLWISPVYLSIGSYQNEDGYHGFWALDFEKIDPHLYTKVPNIPEGSKRYLRLLVDELHKNDMKLILDTIVTHTGYHTEVYQNYPDKRIKPEWFDSGTPQKSKEITLDDLPKLNHKIPDVCDYFVNNMVEWIEESGIDGIRLSLVRQSEKKFWYFFKSYVKGKYKNITFLGEDFDYIKDTKENVAHAYDTLIDTPLQKKIREVFIHEKPLTELARPRVKEDEPKGVLDIDYPFVNSNSLITLLDDHSMPKRFMTEIFEKIGEWDKELAIKIYKLALTFLFTTRGIPQILYGTEIGLEGHSTPENRKDMPWNEVFGGDNLEPVKGTKYQKEIFNHLQKLIKIRRENDALNTGYLFTLSCDRFVYAYLREFRGNTIITVLNNGRWPMDTEMTIPIYSNTNIPERIRQNIRTRRELVNLLNPNDVINAEDGKIQLRLNGKEGKIYCLKD